MSSRNTMEKTEVLSLSWELLVFWGNKQEEAIPSLHPPHPTVNKYFSFLLVFSFNFFTRIFGCFPNYLSESFFSYCFAGCPFCPGIIKRWVLLGVSSQLPSISTLLTPPGSHHLLTGPSLLHTHQ